MKKTSFSVRRVRVPSGNNHHTSFFPAKMICNPTDPVNLYDHLLLNTLIETSNKWCPIRSHYRNRQKAEIYIFLPWDHSDSQVYQSFLVRSALALNHQGDLKVNSKISLKQSLKRLPLKERSHPINELVSIKPQWFNRCWNRQSWWKSIYETSRLGRKHLKNKKLSHQRVLLSKMYFKNLWLNFKKIVLLS